jgi:hypothetical protein
MPLPLARRTMNRFGRHRLASSIGLTTTEYDRSAPCINLDRCAPAWPRRCASATGQDGVAMGVVYYDIYRVEPCGCVQVIVFAFHDVGTSRWRLSAPW